jgi:hypothetical protein
MLYPIFIKKWFWSKKIPQTYQTHFELKNYLIMKKMTLVLMIGVSASLGFFGCTPKMHENLMAKDRVATAPAPTVVNSSNLVPFSRLKMQQLQRNGIDPTQVQFYIDQKVILTQQMK